MHLEPNDRMLRLARVRCRIEPADIEAMDYWLNEAPMSDPSASNAIVFALRRTLRPGLSIRLEQNPNGSLAARIGAHVVELPDGWSRWWAAARQGRSVVPITADLLLPIHLVRHHPSHPTQATLGRERAA
jgi:hypothetical protein